MSTPRDRIEGKLGLAGPPLRHVRDAPPRIPDHELIRRIGQGSYGEVWLARTALGTWRAVKIVYRDNFKDTRPYEREFAGIRRFEPLSRANEGFVDILQVGRDDAEGWFYYVMELADAAERSDGVMESWSDGQAASAQHSTTPTLQDPASYAPRTLSRDLQQRARLPLEDCLQLGLTLSLALGHLHRHGLIHRDVKPSNIIFVGGVPKLADIGLVTEAVGANTFVGTEGFVPPEGPTSPQADLYALGKVLYEAAMGKDRHEFPEPFTQISTDRESVALMELNTILLCACASDPKARYASAEEMHADLALLHSGGSVKRRHQFELRFQIVQRVGAITAAAALVASAAWFWQQQQTGKMTRLAAEKASLATEKTKLADNLARLGEENRQRIVRLDIANGIRTLDEGDPAGALLWFADALPLVTNKPAEESVHRIRIQQVLNQTPRLLQMLPHEHAVTSVAFSSDGSRIATGTQVGEVCAWDSRSGAMLWKATDLSTNGVAQIRFTHDDRRLQASSLPGYGWSAATEGSPTNGAVVIDVVTGRQVFGVFATNLVRADFTPDDRWLVTADKGHVIRVHDANSGQTISEFKGHTDRIQMFSFSTNGILASTGEEHTVRLWRLPSGEPIGSPLSQENQWGGAILSPDGSLLITGNDKSPSIIQRWDVQTGTKVGESIEMPGQIGAMAFVPKSSRRLFISTDQGPARVLDLENNSRSLPPLETVQQIGCWALSSDGRSVALGEKGGKVGLYDLQTGELIFPLHRQAGLVDVQLFSSNGASVLAICTGQTVGLWDLSQPLENATHHLNAPVAPRRVPQTLLSRFSPDRRRFLLILENGTVELVDVPTLREEELSPGNSSAHMCLFAPDNRQWAIAYFHGDESDSPYVVLSREDKVERRRLILPHPRTISGFQFNPASDRLITKCDDGQIRIWRTADGALEKAIPLPQEFDPAGGLFPDGRSGLFYSKAGHFAIFDFVAGATTRKLPWNRERGWQFDHGGERLVTITRDGIGQIWRMPTAEALTPAFQHGGELRWVEWSPDGTRVLTSGVTPEAKVWDAASGNEALLPLRIGNKPLETAQWSLDGRFIVARSDENLVRVWDANTGEPVTPLLKHDGYVRLAHLVTNNRLLTLTLPDLLRAWDVVETRLPTDVIVDYAKLISGRRFNAAGVAVPMNASEQAELSRSLRARVPQLFE